MSVLSDQARWAASVTFDQLPDDVVQRARLQHLSIAGAVRFSSATPLGAQLLGSSRGKERLVGSPKKTNKRAALRFHAGMAAAWDHQDHILWGPVGPGSVCATWSEASGHTLGELLTATVVANEISARLGASGLLAPGSGLGWGGLQAVAAAAATAKLRGLDATRFAHALALSLAGSSAAALTGLARSPLTRALASAEPVVAGVEAVDLAQAGGTGPLDLLDGDGWQKALGCPVPLHAAFSGLGTTWLTRTIAYSLTPGCLHHKVAFQALVEILDRHMRAADKRLRPDQWTECVIRVPWPTWSMEHMSGVGADSFSWSLKSAYAAYALTHELGATEVDPAFWADRRDDLRELMGKIRVEHAWEHSATALTSLFELGGPLLSGVGLPQLKHAMGAFKTTLPAPDAPHATDLMALAKARPDKLLGGLGRHAGDLSSFDTSAWRYVLPIDVKIHTTRGGFWPERRDTLEGAPGWDHANTVERVQEKFAAGDADRVSRSALLLVSDGSSDASEFVAAL
ncbi:MAG: MmgE/PrpD family protein [Proteobacteria bacterium]|nr:MmgE/PrpD family protein [Pseudomonadota bacterium]MCP4918805.1 MmgE/PrpD family protein [Pseudomonadota bacterium]